MGDVGTGKSMLINSLLALLPSQVQPITIPNPHVSYLKLIRFIAGILGIIDKNGNILELIEQMKEALIAARHQGRDYLLIIDEAQVLSNENLEQIRLLSNIEIPEGKLLQIFLVGQYELSRKIDGHSPARSRLRPSPRTTRLPRRMATSPTLSASITRIIRTWPLPRSSWQIRKSLRKISFMLASS